MQRAFKWAVSVGLLDFHPCTAIPKPKAGRRETPMSEEQYQTLLANSRRDCAYALEFTWETGCRPQEIRLLRQEYVQDDVVVFPVKESKGKRRCRVIYLNEKAKAVIDRQPKREWVFVNARGRPWSATNFNNRLQRLKTKLGFKCALYDARHGYGTRKLLEGHPATIVVALMGHSSPQMLEQHYGHVDKTHDHLKRVAKYPRKIESTRSQTFEFFHTNLLLLAEKVPEPIRKRRAELAEDDHHPVTTMAAQRADDNQQRKASLAELRGCSTCMVIRSRCLAPMTSTNCRNCPDRNLLT